ncbi:family 20 glycosylhydrolase [Roseibacillus persicicus]|uniref:family 20 glycosylhydrolase n=1 Tax=Roseibacillus persicicus TaxID=454148 RepID=UPI00280C6558|nr:family 20 glycosylhydrolase [Roseibacillus persicicus]MDQ8189818.1 family 20 glycosylhydrolase [Roseibacillus persicicus]
MKNILTLLAVFLCCLVNPVVAFSPQPQSIIAGEGRFGFSTETRIFYETRVSPRAIESTLRPLAEVFAGELEILTGIKPLLVEKSVNVEPASGDISLEFSAVPGGLVLSEEDEGQSYVLEVGESVKIEGPYYKGISYGTVTFLQALEESEGSYSVPQMTISDSPAAEYRTVMIDVARQPSGIGMLKEVVRLARQFKLRYVQLHLTDDQHFTFPFSPVTDNLSNNFTYSRAELLDLVEYADARGVTLIPELDLPGHSSRLRESGYLNPSANDADVAAPANYSKIEAIIDDMLSVFVNSPYFHIGGDESQAGSALEPFLANINEHLRGTPVGGKRRMLVWEGFHGAPVNSLPATGDDRVIVLSWESSYNAPWDLLNAGYTVVNASWKPLYVVGNRSGVRYAHSLQRMWSPEVIHTWNKDTFMHWEPGRPVFEDTGPNDPDDDDGVWDANWIERQDQVIGGQMLSWEQNEKSIVGDLLPRLPVMADRLWNPVDSEDYAGFETRLAGVREKALAIVHPVEILPLSEDPEAFLSNPDYRNYTGDSVSIELRNRTKIPGTIRYEVGGSNNSLSALNFDEVPETTPTSTAYSGEFNRTGGFGIRAALYRQDTGEIVDGHDYQFFSNLENRVRVTSYQVPRRPLGQVPDLASYGQTEIKAVYELPILHGPYIHTESIAQKHDAILTVPETGEYEFELRTNQGRGSFYLDLNKNGLWDADELLIADTTPDEAAKDARVVLNTGEYRFRLDHVTNPIGATILLSMEGPGTGGRKDIQEYLSLPNAPVGPPIEPQPLSPADEAVGITPDAPFLWTANGATSYEVYLWRTGQPEPTMPTAMVFGSFYEHDGLDELTAYSWKIVSHNELGSTTSSTWTFTTGARPEIGALLLHEEFDGYSPGSIIGQAAQGYGLTGNWEFGGSEGSFELGPGLSGENGLVVTATGAGDLDGKIAHTVEEWGSGVLYLSYLWHETSFWGHVYVSGGGSWEGAFGHAWTRAWGINNASEGVAYDLNRTYRLVARIDFDEGSTTMWADPLAESDLPVVFKNEAQAALPRSLILRFYGTDGTIDDLRVGTNFEGVIADLSNRELELLSFTLQGTQGTLSFRGSVGVSSWRVMASTDLVAFDIDETSNAVITEDSPGIYTAELDLTGFPDRYFLRVEG